MVPAEGENHPGAGLESSLTDKEGREANKCLIDNFRCAGMKKFTEHTQRNSAPAFPMRKVII